MGSVDFVRILSPVETMASPIMRAKDTANKFGRISAWKKEVPMTRYGMKLRAEKTYVHIMFPSTKMGVLTPVMSMVSSVHGLSWFCTPRTRGMIRLLTATPTSRKEM